MISVKQFFIKLLSISKPNYAFYKWPAASTICPINKTLTITTKRGNPVFISTSGDMNPTSAGDWMMVKFFRDDTEIAMQTVENNGVSYNMGFFMQYLDKVDKGEHSYRVEYVMGSGTGNLAEEYSSTAVHTPQFLVFET